MIEELVAEVDEKRPPAPPQMALRDAHWQEIYADAQEFEKTLRSFDRGRLAALRRNAGTMLGQARGVAWIHRHLHGNRRKFDEQYFLIATLFDLNRKAARCEDLGATLLRVKSTDSFERRFLVLLEAEFDRTSDALDGYKMGGGELAYRLGQMVRLAASKNEGICWPILLADLCCWDRLNKPVQKKWARNFYAPKLAEEIEEDAATTAAATPAQETI